MSMCFHRSRRQIFQSSLVGIIWSIAPTLTRAVDQDHLVTLRDQVAQARDQLVPVPSLIEKEQWDSVRAILITPPLSDCWTKSKRATPLLADYADAVGGADGDELAVLELKDEVESRLRFLDMAVYNNVFNPIKTEGKTGATKELVRSYYEDPINEYKGSKAALDELVKLGNP